MLEQGWAGPVHYKQIADFATAHQIPTGGEFPSYVNVGGLGYYGPKTGQATASVTALVDNILRGAKPADLPVEQPTRLGFVLNLKIAKAIGLTFPPALLARADEIVE